MKSPSEFQTSGVVLLAGTMITGFLTVVVLLPMLRQEALRPRIVKAADQVPLSSPLREEAARLNEFAVATTAGEPQHGENSAARSGMDVSEASHRRTASARTEPNSAATTRDEDRERPHHAGMPVGSPSLIDSEGRRYVPQQVAAATPLSDLPSSDPLSSGPMYRQRVSRQMSSDRGDESAATFPRSEFQPSFYAPVTVHPVTVNIDGGIFGEHLQALN
ncbi:MAG: hypothetical protein KDA81_19875, partial [Planctomycetaceae bacterium]|nr:hypothetical protein [Planctomycetaceae bacterium]